MPYEKRWSFGIGTIFSLIVVYFIFLYSRDKQWTLLAFISKWYLIIAGGFIALSFSVVILIILLALIMFLVGYLRLKLHKKKEREKKSEKFIDAEYEVKE